MNENTKLKIQVSNKNAPDKLFCIRMKNELYSVKVYYLNNGSTYQNDLDNDCIDPAGISVAVKELKDNIPGIKCIIKTDATEQIFSVHIKEGSFIQISDIETYIEAVRIAADTIEQIVTVLKEYFPKQIYDQ